MYIHRTLEKKFIEMNDFFKVLLVNGPRQVGKTTMLKKLANNQKRTYVTLDNLEVRKMAKEEPAHFFQIYDLPIIIDEVQYAPELFPYIKLLVDQSDKTGQIWLTGSQQYNLMKNIQESLAGRVGILNLYPFSNSEINEIQFNSELLFDLESLKKRQEMVQSNSLKEIFHRIWAGGMPQVLNATDSQKETYFEGYINTYLMRDVVELGGVRDVIKFRTFLSACAALIGKQLNFKNLSDVVGIDQETAKRWLNLLESLGIIYLLHPYHNNQLKRLNKTPKLYFIDTGLASHLSMWLTAETLMMGASSGHYFENYIVIELLKSYEYGQHKANLTYIRDSNDKEIDVIVEYGRQIYTLEIKMSASPNRRDVKKFKMLEKTEVKIAGGGIVCNIERLLPVDDMYNFIPANLI
jgi:predicted AAA+ superfamily ATPase